MERRNQRMIEMASHLGTPRGSNLLYATGEEEDSDIIASNMVNEAMDLNTAGRSNADDRDNYVRVSLRNVTRIGTWNV